jgi:hypothetical protein
MKEKKKSIKSKMKGGKYFIKLNNGDTIDLPIKSSAFSEIDSRNRSKFIDIAKKIARLGQINKVLLDELIEINDNFNEFNERYPNEPQPKQLSENLQKIYEEIWTEIYNLETTPIKPEKVATNTYFKTASEKIGEINYKTYDEFTNDIKAGKSKLMNIFSTLSGDPKKDPFQCMAKGYDALLSAN